MTPTTRRVLAAALPPVLAALPTLLLFLTAGDRLPDTLPVHFTAGGVADRFAEPWVAALVPAGLGAALAVTFGALAVAVGRRDTTAPGTGDEGRLLVGGSWALSGFLGPLLLAPVAAVLDRATAEGAVLPGWAVPVGLATAALAGVVGHRLAPPTPHAGESPAPAEPLEVGPTERVSWSRTVVSRTTLLAAGGAALAGAAATGLGAHPAVAAGGLLLGALVAALGTARVTVDRQGLVVALGPLGRPRIHVPVEDVAEAAAAEVSPMRFGGWGYRVVPGGRGVILRAGPGLVVTRRSGQRLTVTVDDADTAAGLLATLAGSPRC